MASGLGKRCGFHNEWTLRDGFQTLWRSRKPLWHTGQRGSSALTRTLKQPEFDAPKISPGGLKKQGDGFQTLPSDASPPPTSTTSLTPTERARASANWRPGSASTARPSLPTSTASTCLATTPGPHGTTAPSKKPPSCTQPGCRWPTSLTGIRSTQQRERQLTMACRTGAHCRPTSMLRPSTTACPPGVPVQH